MNFKTGGSVSALLDISDRQDGIYNINYDIFLHRELFYSIKIINLVTVYSGAL